MPCSYLDGTEAVATPDKQLEPMSPKPFHGYPFAVPLPHTFSPLALPSQMPSGLPHVALDAFHDALRS